MKTEGRKELAVVLGAGEMASGVILELSRNQYYVIALEQPNPSCVRRYVCFAQAVYSGEIEIEGVRGKLAGSCDESTGLASMGVVPVLIDPGAESLKLRKPDILVDGRMLKRNIGITPDMASLVIGLGPGFFAGKNCHYAIETNRGPDLGRVLFSGSPQEDTAIPAPVNGFTTERVLRAPIDGTIVCNYEIGDAMEEGDIVAEVSGVPVTSRIKGVLRGICRDGITVERGQKIGDIDPRGKRDLCFNISDKAWAIAGGVIVAIRQNAESRVIKSG